MSDNIIYPVTHNDSVGQDYVTFPVDPLASSDTPGNNYSLYINYANFCEPGNFVWDYFSSGELYINLPQGQSIKGAKTTIISLFRNFLLNPTKLGNVCSIGAKPYDFVTSVKSPTSNDELLCAWMFNLEKFFEIEETSFSSPTPNPISLCSFLTIKNTAKSITIKSDSYSFGNFIDDTPVCSCPKMNSDSSTFAYCSPYLMGAHMDTCIGYSPKKEVLKSNLVTQENTENSLVLVLEYSLATNFDHKFEISSISHNKEVNHISTLNYPITENYEELLPSVISIYEEFLNNYVNSIKSDYSYSLEENNDLQVNPSYISSLLTV